MTTESAPSRAALPTLGWAAFLAVSWTWCIGMFLPVLLVRDYGAIGWAIFAVPNVVGAAAMGWVIKSRESSERMVDRHAAAGTCFSVATIAFNALFMAGLLSWLLGPIAALVLAPAAIAVGAIANRGQSFRLVGAAVILACSIAAFAVVVANAGMVPLTNGREPARDLVWLALVCAYGFLLCPYLDLTFHRARQATSQFGAIAAFTIGFGALFLVMILFTLWYAPLFASTSPPALDVAVGRAARWAICTHVALQAGFTIAAHAREVRRQWRTGRRDVAQGVWVGVALGAAALLAGLLLGSTPRYRALGSFELSYRLFMSFYALLAPSYVWLCVVPARRSARIPAARHFAVFLIAVALAGPLFWVAFIERRMIWIGPALAIVFAARLLVRGQGARASQNA